MTECIDQTMKRWTAKRKAEVVLRLFRGESIDEESLSLYFMELVLLQIARKQYNPKNRDHSRFHIIHSMMIISSWPTPCPLVELPSLFVHLNHPHSLATLNTLLIHYRLFAEDYPRVLKAFY